MFSWQRKLGPSDSLPPDVENAVLETIDCLHPEKDKARVHYVLQSSPAGKTVVGAVVDDLDGDWWCADYDLCGPHGTAKDARDCLIERLYDGEGPIWERKPRRRRLLPVLGPRLRVSALAERRAL